MISPAAAQVDSPRHFSNADLNSSVSLPVNAAEDQYLSLMQRILDQGSVRLDRTGVGTKAIFGAQMRFDLSEGFPLLTTKRVFWKTAFKEMLWMLSGSTSLRELLIQNVRIWTDWPLQKYRDATGHQMDQNAFEEKIINDPIFDLKWGDLGPIYGKQWRKWLCADGREIDQVQNVIDLIRNNPSSRRILWDGWNVGELDQMALPPCHKHYQFFVRDGHLDAAVVIRSNDVFLGAPFNIANLALLTHMLAQQCDLKPGEIVWNGMDVHIYLNHFDAVKTQLLRNPMPFPELKLVGKPKSLFDYTLENFEIIGYEPMPAIAAPVAV
jgi:thymidylate synthase